jgi:putative methyltransferase (TIGR04325 family)
MKVKKFFQLNRILSRNFSRPIENKIETYNNNVLVEHIVKRTDLYRKKLQDTKEVSLMDLTILCLPGLCNLNSDSVILDFGGAAGVHYDVFNTIYPHLKVKWLIVETPQMVKLGERANSDSLQYYQSISDVFTNFKHVDVIFANSSLQYTDAPIESLTNLLKLSPKFFFLVRTAMTSSKAFTTIQKSSLKSNGPSVTDTLKEDRDVMYQINVQSEEEYSSAFSNKYKLVFKMDNGRLHNLIGPKDTCLLSSHFYERAK